MSYAQGGLISATDYNGLAQTNTANVAWVWGTGWGANGYGQSTTGISTLSVGATVTATQWAGLFNIINRCLGHQGQTQLMGGGNINAIAGSLITYWSNVASSVTTINNNAAGFGSQGSTTTLTANTWVSSAAASASYNQFIDVNVNFASADQARTFFNAGGQLNITYSAVSNQNNQRSNNLRDLINQIGGITAYRNFTNGGRTGAGGTYTGNTAIGYRTTIFGVETLAARTTSGAPYASDLAEIQIFHGDNTSTNGALGASPIFRCRAFSAADDTFNNAIDLTITTQVAIVFPETTYLTNVYGSVTDSRDNS